MHVRLANASTIPPLLEAIMNSQRAIFLALDAMFRPTAGPDGYGWLFDPRLPGLLRDFRALGFKLIGILDPSAFGLELDTPDEQGELVAYINQLLVDSGAPDLSAVHVTDNVTDPRAIWDLRARFGLSLQDSLLVATGPEYDGLFKNAGIGYYEPAVELLGPVYQFAAAS